MSAIPDPLDDLRLDDCREGSDDQLSGRLQTRSGGEMGHTPGPWSACHEGKCKCKRVMGHDYPVAQVIHGKWGDDYPDIRLEKNESTIGLKAVAFTNQITYGEIPEEVAEANARLIAAAPELLAACKAALDSIGETERMTWASDLHTQLTAAIRKAEEKGE